MLREVLRSKIYYAAITQAKLYYQGSITIDEVIMKKADIAAGEKVHVLNLNSGARFQTYVIKGKRNSGTICLNGPAARLGQVGDKVVILAYGAISETEMAKHKSRFVVLSNRNKIRRVFFKKH
jgi:aspartate 1-decarboxylase